MSNDKPNRINNWDVVEPIPTDSHFSGIFTKQPWSNTPNRYGENYPFLAHHRAPGGSSTSQHKTREDAEKSLEDTLAFHRNFWEKKVAYKEAGDISPHGSICIRIGGKHFMADPMTGEGHSVSSAGNGFGGRLFRWRMIETGEEFWSNNMWHQGVIPPEFRDRLPDNAAWIENTSAVR